MAQVKIDLKDKPNAVIITQAKAYVSSLTGNANFPTTSPTLAEMGAAIDAAEAGVTARKDAEALVRLRVEQENALVLALYGEIVKLASSIQTQSGGDAEKILSSGFQVRDEATPPQPLPAPIDFLATMGDHAGTMDLVWSRVKGARGYIVECREHLDGTPWAAPKFCTASKITLTGLTSGKTYAFRVMAVGPAGDGPWSAETARMAP